MTIKLLLRVTFLLSLSLIIISVWSLISAKLKVEANVRQWEKLKEQVAVAITEDDLQFNPLLVQPLFHIAAEEQVEIKESETDHPNMKDEALKSPLYDDYPELNELIGVIMIPQLDRELPIIHGTDNKQLAEGVGHYVGSALPGEHNNTVLAGHRDTVFRGLGQLQIGDQIHIETKDGVFIYEITRQQIVEADDRTIIVNYDEPILTLITCYPFEYIGPAPKRYIVTGKLIDP